MSNEKQFPIQAENKFIPGQGNVHLERSYIPWWLAEIAYSYYSRRFGNSQSLERLAERGGFGRDELVILLVGAGVDRFIV